MNNNNLNQSYIYQKVEGIEVKSSIGILDFMSCAVVSVDRDTPEHDGRLPVYAIGSYRDAMDENYTRSWN